MKAHLIDTHLLVPRSRSYAKVKVKHQSNISQKMAALQALVFHKHILLFFHAPASKHHGHIVLLLSVCLSVCLPSQT